MGLLILLHRYMGIAIGFVVSLWCLSAFVMLYVQYPEFTDAERVIGLDDLHLSTCCSLAGRQQQPALADVLGMDELRRIRIEMLAREPVLRAFGRFGQVVVDLSDWNIRNNLSPTDAGAVSLAFQDRMSLAGQFENTGTIAHDQWTVYASYRPHQPLYHFALDDPAKTQWYVSGRTGEVVQITTARERFWNWMGSVTHWIYFTALRQHGYAWSQTVIALTIVALFLTTIGVYIGIKRLGRSGAMGGCHRSAAGCSGITTRA